MPGAELKVGIDVGGTFTDLVVVEPDGSWDVHKVPSTPHDPALAVLDGLDDLAERRHVPLPAFLARVERIVHGTTVTTNALLTGTGARTGLLTNAGLRDALEMRRGVREEHYDNKVVPPPPLVPRWRRLPVRGRLGPEGQELEPLHEVDVIVAADRLRAEGTESVAICLMHSYANPRHEQRVLEHLRRELPGAYVTASADLVPQMGFYERVSTTVLNAYVGPILDRYLRSLVDRLEAVGYRGVLLIMQSNGGVTAWDTAVQNAATTLLSGPAGGPVAAAEVSMALAYGECIAVDMGGTSFEAALVRSRRPLVVADAQVARYALNFPILDVHTVGAGGGSIGWIDGGGLLRMGPQSAGAVPGPACYGQGGELPTCTDADLVLGYLDPDYFLGGRIRLDRDAALRAIERHVARPLGLDVEAAAAGMYRVINSNMAAGVRAVSVRRGIDPRTMPLIVAGGAGPIHAGAIAAELGIPVFLVPRYSAAFCAAGMLFTDLRHDFVRTFRAPLAHVDFAALADLFRGLEARGAEVLVAEGIPPAEIEFARSVGMRYKGQHHDVNLPLDPDSLDRGAAAIASRFHAAHDDLYGYSTPAAALEVMNLRLAAIGRTRKPALRELSPAGEASDHARKGERSAWLPGSDGYEVVPIYDGFRLDCGNRVSGPAIIELPTTTIVIPRDHAALIDRIGNFILTAVDVGAAAGSRTARS